MEKNKAMYWSSLEIFETCPQKFIWKYGHELCDFGDGPGKPKPVTTKRSEHHMVMGIVIQKVIEDFYNSGGCTGIIENGRDRDYMVSVLDKLQDDTIENFSLEMKREDRYVDYSASPSYKVMQKICIDGVIGYIKTIIANNLIGEVNEAEKRIVVRNLKVGDVNIDIGAKMDVYIEKKSGKNSGITILDGKNSENIGKYTNKDQLILYAACLFLETKKLPDRMGFVYYRFPYGTNVSDLPSSYINKDYNGIDWIEFDKKSILGILERVAESKRKIMEYGVRFPATPKPKHCCFCDWESVCPDRQIQIESNRGSKKKSVFIVDNREHFAEGFVEIENPENIRWK